MKNGEKRGLEIVEVKCENCGKTLYVLDKCVREKMYCTIGCMDGFNNNKSPIMTMVGYDHKNNDINNGVKA